MPKSTTSIGVTKTIIGYIENGFTLSKRSSAMVSPRRVDGGGDTQRKDVARNKESRWALVLAEKHCHVGVAQNGTASNH